MVSFDKDGIFVDVSVSFYCSSGGESGVGLSLLDKRD